MANMKVAVATDSNSGLTQEQGKMYGVHVVPMSFMVNGKEYLEGVSLDREEFLAMLKQGAEVKTSQASLGIVKETWETLLEKYDQVIYIPMSSGIGGSTQSAMALAAEFPDKVFVVDNHRISVTQKQSVLDASRLAIKGRDGRYIKEYLEKYAYDASIYIAVDTLEYLKKSGRVTGAGAAIGTVLNIKPVLQIQGEKLDAYAKVRGMKQAQKIMLQAIENDLNNRFAHDAVFIKGAYSCDEETAQKWRKTIAERFPDYEVSVEPLSMNVCCHTGAGAIGVGCMKRLTDIEF